MRAHLPKRTAIAIVLVTAGLVAIGCGSDTTPPKDAGVDAAAEAEAEGGPLDAAAETSAPDADAASPLAISPLTPAATGCSTTLVTFTASGGTPPYTWSTSDTSSNDLVVTSATQATWEDNADNFCGQGGSVTVTVKDSVGATATATITVTGG